MSAPIPPPGDPEPEGEKNSAQERAAGALRDAFTRLQPQGSDAWNFLAAFTHLGDRYGPYQPGASGLSRLLGHAAPTSSRRQGRLARLRPVTERPSPEGGQSELEEAMAQVVEAFRFLASRVSTLERRLAFQDRPVDGAAYLVPARELGDWIAPMAGHIVATTPGGDVLHGDCGEGDLLHALMERGVPAVGIEPRGSVALAALERGCAVTICEVTEGMESRPADSLGGVVLSGAVDRLPLHALLPLLAQARRALRLSAPIVVVVTDPDDEVAWVTPALDLVEARPMHEQTWAMLLDRAGFVDIAPLRREGAGDGRFALSASTPA